MGTENTLAKNKTPCDSSGVWITPPPLFVGQPMAHFQRCQSFGGGATPSFVNGRTTSNDPPLFLPGQGGTTIAHTPKPQPQQHRLLFSSRATTNHSSGYRRNPRPKQLPNRHHEKQSRSKSVRGATNLSKETKLLRNKMDRLLENFQETLGASVQSSTTQLESLMAENKQLQTHVSELETETLKQFSELEDCDELIVATEEQRLSLEAEANLWKRRCEKLVREVEFWKGTATGKTNPTMVFGNSIPPQRELPNEKDFSVEESQKSTSTIVLTRKDNALGNKENNGRTGRTGNVSNHHGARGPFWHASYKKGISADAAAAAGGMPESFSNNIVESLPKVWQSMALRRRQRRTKIICSEEDKICKVEYMHSMYVHKL